MSNSIFGNENFAFGPAKLYWDTESGGENLDLGGTDSIKVTLAVKKIELKESQAGDRPADRAVASQTYQISCGLSRATLERLEQVVQGIYVEKDTADSPTQIHGIDILGQRDSSIVKQLTLVAIVNGVESTDPFDIIDFWKVAPMTESTELTFDASTQRYYGVMFECYKDDTHTDDQGRSTYFSSRVVV